MWSQWVWLSKIVISKSWFWASASLSVNLQIPVPASIKSRLFPTLTSRHGVFPPYFRVCCAGVGTDPLTPQKVISNFVWELIELNIPYPLYMLLRGQCYHEILRKTGQICHLWAHFSMQIFPASSGWFEKKSAFLVLTFSSFVVTDMSTLVHLRWSVGSFFRLSGHIVGSLLTFGRVAFGRFWRGLSAKKWIWWKERGVTNG